MPRSRSRHHIAVALFEKNNPPKNDAFIEKERQANKGETSLLSPPPPPPSTSIVRRRNYATAATPPPPAANMAEREMYINEKLAVCLLYVVSKEKVESYAGRQQMELMGSCNETLHHSPKQS